METTEISETLNEAAEHNNEHAQEHGHPPAAGWATNPFASGSAS